MQIVENVVDFKGYLQVEIDRYIDYKYNYP